MPKVATEQSQEEKMKQLQFHFDGGCQVSNFGMGYQRISPKWKILCCLAALVGLLSAAYAGDGLIGKWRALDDTNIIYGFAFIPELKFSEDGTLHAGIKYGYRIIDDSKFEWEMGHGIKRIYKYEITGDLLMIYAIGASDDRTRFKRVR